MDPKKSYIAIDLGAESGRVILGQLHDEISLVEVHRFSNTPLQDEGTLYWNLPELLREIYAGVSQACAQSDSIQSVAVDSWGVDYGLMDGEGRVLGKPYHYRDRRVDGMMAKVFEIIPRRRIYDLTGIQFMPINTLYQLLAAMQAEGGISASACHLVFIADLVAYHLSGKIFAEYTLASTSQLLNMQTGEWEDELFEQLALPRQIMPRVVQAGTVIGPLTEQAAQERGASQISVVAVGSHDTASAVAAAPATGDRWAFLSSGTWSLMGVELSHPVINETSYQYQFTNEGGIGDTIRLLKNIMGLWLIQECRRQWQAEGAAYSYSELTSMAQQAEPFSAVFSVNDGSFLSPGDMPARINQVLSKLGQAAITGHAQMTRAILENLAFYYRRVLEMIEEIIAKPIEVLHVLGGGCQNTLLCQFTANALNRRVIAGPVEATALGNIMVQALAMGQMASLTHVREVVGRSVDLVEYKPRDTGLWEETYTRHKSLIDDTENK